MNIHLKTKKSYGLPDTITKTNYNCIKNLNMKFTNIKTLENFITTCHYVLWGENFFHSDTKKYKQ